MDEYYKSCTDSLRDALRRAIVYPVLPRHARFGARDTKKST